MIRGLLNTLWAWSRDRASDAGRTVGDPDTLGLRGLCVRLGCWLLLTPEQRKAKRGQGWRPRPGALDGGHSRWLCEGCGRGGTSSNEQAARADADYHASTHGFEHGVPIVENRV